MLKQYHHLLCVVLLQTVTAFLRLPCRDMLQQQPVASFSRIRSSSSILDERITRSRSRSSSRWPHSNAAFKHHYHGFQLLAKIDNEAGKKNDQPTLQDLIENDPKEKGLLAYLGFVTVALLALGIGSYKLGGPLLGLGFSDDKFMYWDSAPSYSLLIVYPPLFFLYPEAGGVLLKTLLLSLAVTLVIWFFPFDAIGWEPTNDHVAITVGVPIVAYLTFFTWRAAKVYSEIVEEEREDR